MLANFASILQCFTLGTLLGIEQTSYIYFGNAQRMRKNELPAIKVEKGKFMECFQIPGGRNYFYNTCDCGRIDVIGNFGKIWMPRTYRPGRHFKTSHYDNAYQPSSEKFSTPTNTTKHELEKDEYQSEQFVSVWKSRVIKGNVAYIGQVPWYVLLQDLNTPEICGGTILNRLYILTAAHCTELFRKRVTGRTYNHTYPKNILVIPKQPNVCLENRTLEPNDTRLVNQVIEHPFYKKSSTGVTVYDFALLLVDRGFKEFGLSLKPVCLPPHFLLDKQFVGKDAALSGYGRTEANKQEGKDQTSCNLKALILPIVDPGLPQCLKVSKDKEVQMCGYSTGKDSCQGDSGGPMTATFPKLTNGSVTNFLIGVVSYGSTQCSREKTAGVYARVTKVMPWIVAHIQMGECRYNGIKKENRKIITCLSMHGLTGWRG